MNAVIDVWGGIDGFDNLARYIRSDAEAVLIVYQELHAGFRLTISQYDPAACERGEFDYRSEFRHATFAGTRH